MQTITCPHLTYRTLRLLRLLESFLHKNKPSIPSLTIRLQKLWWPLHEHKARYRLPGVPHLSLKITLRAGDWNIFHYLPDAIAWLFIGKWLIIPTVLGVINGTMYSIRILNRDEQSGRAKGRVVNWLGNLHTLSDGEGWFCEHIFSGFSHIARIVH